MHKPCPNCINFVSCQERLNLETGVDANLRMKMRIEMGRSVVSAKAGTHLRSCSTGGNGFPASRE